MTRARALSTLSAPDKSLMRRFNRWRAPRLGALVDAACHPGRRWMAVGIDRHRRVVVARPDAVPRHRSRRLRGDLRNRHVPQGEATGLPDKAA